MLEIRILDGRSASELVELDVDALRRAHGETVNADAKEHQQNALPHDHRARETFCVQAGREDFLSYLILLDRR